MTAPRAATIIREISAGLGISLFVGYLWTRQANDHKRKVAEHFALCDQIEKRTPITLEALKKDDEISLGEDEE